MPVTRATVGRFRRLLRHGNADINMGMSEFGTLLCMAAYVGHTGIARELLSMPGIDVNLAGYAGSTPLYLAAQLGHVKVVELLLAERDINVNLATNRGETPLHVAIVHGRPSIVRLLLAADGINVNSTMLEDHSTPLHYASFLRHEDIAGLLLDMPEIDTSRRTVEGATAVYIATQLGFHGIAEQLVRRGADVNLALPKGTTALQVAIDAGDIRMVRILLRAPGILVNQATHRGAVPLGMAARTGHKDIARLLLRHGADPNIICAGGFTPFQIACLYGSTAIVQMLLHAGAGMDVDVKDTEGEGLGQTPYYLAELGGHREVMSVLAAHRRRREAALHRPGQQPATEVTGEDTETPPVESGTTSEGEAGAATVHVSPVPPAPSPPGEAASQTEPPTPLAQAKEALRQEVLGKLRADNFDMHEGIQLLIAVNAAIDMDELCTLYNQLAHIERQKERARRRGRRGRRFGLVAGGAAAPGQSEPVTLVFALEERTGLDADAVEVEIKHHLDQAYHRFVSQAVNDMEFGRGKPTSGYPGLWHVSAGVPGVGSCSVFYYLEESGERIRVVGIGHHVRRAAYQLDYASAELGDVGRILRIA